MAKKGKKNNTDTVKRDIELKGEMEEYARIEKELGNRRMTLTLPDESTILGIIPGRFRRGRRFRMGVGDVVLISYRGYQDRRCDIIHKYTSDEAKKLTKKGEIPVGFAEGGGLGVCDEDGVSFGVEEEEEDEFDFDDI